MNVEPMYLTIFLIAGGIIFLVLFFHYVPFFLWLSAKYQELISLWYNFF